MDALLLLACLGALCVGAACCLLGLFVLWLAAPSVVRALATDEDLDAETSEAVNVACLYVVGGVLLISAGAAIAPWLAVV